MGCGRKAYDKHYRIYYMKFKEFSMAFQDLFKQIQVLHYQVKLECFTHFLKSQFDNVRAIFTSFHIPLYTELVES